MRAALVVLFLALATVAHAEERRAVVVVFAAEVSEEKAEKILGAVRAHTADMGVALTVAERARDDADVRKRMERASRLAQESGALGTFFFELESERDVLVYLFEPRGARVLLRRVRVAEAEAAATEEVAAIVRGTIAALLDGQEIGMTAPPRTITFAEPPPREVQVAPAPRLRDRAGPPPAGPDTARVRAGVLYAGNIYAEQQAWQSGARLEVLWLAGPGFYAGGGYLLYPTTEVRSQLATMEVTRHIGEIILGVELKNALFGLGGELELMVDTTLRSTRATTAGLEATPDAQRWSLGGAARVQTFWQWMKTSRLLLGIGVEIFPLQPAYVAEFPTETVLLAPRVFRPRLDAGVTVDF
jgi:hypothetical protein